MLFNNQIPMVEILLSLMLSSMVDAGKYVNTKNIMHVEQL